MVRRTTLRGVAVAVLAVAALAGCGSDNGGNGNGGDTQNSGSASSPANGGQTGAPGGTAGGTITDAAGVQAVQAKLDELLKASPIKFEPFKADLPEASKATLKQIAEAATAVQGGKLTITCAAAVGDPEKSKQLSQQRADAVSKELTADGLAADRVTATGSGNEGISAGDVTSATSTKITVSQ